MHLPFKLNCISMFSLDYQPSESLKEYAKVYRLRHFVFQQKIDITFKPFPPRPEQCLIFYPRGAEVTEDTYSKIKIQRPRSVISGQFTHRINRYVAYPEFLMIEVDLRPGALHRLTGIPFKELSNKDIDAEAFFPSEMCRVNERLSNVNSYAEMITIIEAFLQNLVQKQKMDYLAVDHTLHLMTCNAHSCSVDLLAKQTFLSPRQLERKFDERIGVSPKTFLRICRFNQSYWMRLKQPTLDWLSIAIACGYNDYQHLVKDYKEFANTTPNLLFSEERNAPGRMLGLTKY